jgi:hypothetical protein
MSNQIVILKEIFVKSLEESILHFQRLEIAHDYEMTNNRGCNLLNSIYSHSEDLRSIIQSFQLYT